MAGNIWVKMVILEKAIDYINSILNIKGLTAYVEKDIFFIEYENFNGHIFELVFNAQLALSKPEDAKISMIANDIITSYYQYMIDHIVSLGLAIPVIKFDVFRFDTKAKRLLIKASVPSHNDKELMVVASKLPNTYMDMFNLIESVVPTIYDEILKS